MTTHGVVIARSELPDMATFFVIARRAVPDVAIFSKPTIDGVGSVSPRNQSSLFTGYIFVTHIHSVLTARRFFTAFRMTVESLE